MAAAWTRFFSHSWVAILEALAVVVLLVLLTVGILIWRINTGPLDVSFAKDYVESALRDEESGYSLTLGAVQASWPDLRGPVRLDLKNVSLLKDERAVLNVGGIGISLSKSRLLLGQIAPQGIVINYPSLRLLRTKDNRIVLSLKDELPDAEGRDENGQEGVLMQMVQRLAEPPSPDAPHTVTDRLESLEIHHARTVVEDHTRELTWYLPDVDMMFVRDDKGLVLTADMALPGTADKPSHIRADIAYSRRTKNTKASLTLKNVDPDVLGGKLDELDFLAPHDITISGELEAMLDEKMDLQALALDVYAGAGALDLPDFYNEPFTFDSMDIAMRYDNVTHHLALTNASIETQGVSLRVTADGTIDKTGGTLAVNVDIPILPQDKIDMFWPDSARSERAAEWLIHKMSGGRFEKIAAHFNLKAARVADENGGEKWGVNATGITGDISLADMTVNYRDPLMPLTGAQAHGHYENDNLVINIEKGRLGELDVPKGTVTLTDLIHGTPGGVRVDAQVNGALPDVLAYIAREPIGMGGEKLGFDAKAARGKVTLGVNVSFPALHDLPAEKVKVAVKGQVTNALVPGVVKDLALTGGPLALNVGDGMVKLEGDGKLDGRDIKVQWEQFLESAGKPYMGRVNAELVSDKALRDKLGVKIDDWVVGAVPVKIVYTEYRDGKSDIDVNADLTPAIVTVKPFKYEKPVGVKASATALVTMQDNVPQAIKNLSVHTPELNFDNALLTFKQGELAKGSFPRITLNDNDMRLDIDFLQGGIIKLAMGGAFFDATPFLKKDPAAKKEPYTGPAIIASIDVGRMRAHPGRVVEKSRIYLEMAADGMINRLDMDCIAGRGAVALRLRPDTTGKMAVRLEAADAGAAMNAFGIYDNVAGGKLVIQGQAATGKNPRTLYGTVELTDFRAVNAPILARLVSAISPTGLAELLASDGIYFARLESKFDWYMRPQGDLYLVNGGRTSGSSLGLTFEGQIDKATGQIDINGNIVPMSMLNDIIGAIPIIGTILSGGSEGGVFAATYTINGSQEKPDVSVNPLSVLAPGIIRRILFEEN